MTRLIIITWGRPDPTLQLTWGQLPRQSIFYNLFVEKCDCNGTCQCAVVFPSLITCRAQVLWDRNSPWTWSYWNEITKLRYEGNSNHIQKLRNPLIRSYKGWVRIYVPPQLTCSAMVPQNPMPLLSVVTDAPWQIIRQFKKEKKSRLPRDVQVSSICLCSAKGSVPINQTKTKNWRSWNFWGLLC